MSKLPYAPLVEVVFELHWNVSTSDVTKTQYLYGDLYNLLKEKYPYREIVNSPEIPFEILVDKPVHRYRNNLGGYPLIQIGPGLLTLNCTEKNYYWDEFYENSNQLVSNFLEIHTFLPTEKIRASLFYLDFFEFDFEKINIHDFLNNNFNLMVEQSFLDTDSLPTDLNLGFFFKVECGDISVQLKRGKNSDKRDGIILQTKLNGPYLHSKADEISNWLTTAHETCSDIFKRIFKIEFYNTFN